MREAKSLHTESNLGVPELAITAQKVFGTVLVSAGWTNAVIQDFSRLGQDEQDGWTRVAVAALSFDERGIEGKPADVAKLLMEAYFENDEYPDSPALLLAWEAVTRHLAYLTSQHDENESLSELEQSWVEWAKKRTQPTVTQEEAPPETAEKVEQLELWSGLI